MDLDTHPNPQPNPHHRKIELQSPHDLTYLQTNLADSAVQKLDLHFPKLSKPATHISLGDTRPEAPQQTKEKDNPTTSQTADAEDEDDDDPMRRRVHDLISEFLTSTWRSAGHSISVNGIDASTIQTPHTATLSDPPAKPASPSKDTSIRAEIEGQDFQYAPFDASLQHKLASLHGELEALTAQVSKLRRTAPGQGAEAYQKRLQEAMQMDDEAYEAAMGEEEELEELQIDQVRDGWNEDVREMYERGVAELVSLAGVGAERTSGGSTLTETVGKAQRARNVAMEME